MKIISLWNPRIKRVVKLKERKGSNTDGLFLVNGMREIMQAKAGMAKIRELYVCREFCKGKGFEEFIEEASMKKISVCEVTPGVYIKIAYGERREGIIAVCQPLKRKSSDIPLSENPLLVIAESIEKPGNLGAIIRSGDGAGVDMVMVSDGETDIFNPNIIRASMGTVFAVPIVQSPREDILKFLREKNVKIIATSPAADAVYTDTNLKGPLAIVVGSEQKGLSDFWTQNADACVQIPMKGKVDSLNVGNSTAIMLYEAVRQRSL